MESTARSPERRCAGRAQPGVEACQSVVRVRGRHQPGNVVAAAKGTGVLLSDRSGAVRVEMSPGSPSWRGQGRRGGSGRRRGARRRAEYERGVAIEADAARPRKARLAVGAAAKLLLLRKQEILRRLRAWEWPSDDYRDPGRRQQDAANHDRPKEGPVLLDSIGGLQTLRWPVEQEIRRTGNWRRCRFHEWLAGR